MHTRAGAVANARGGWINHTAAAAAANTALPKTASATSFAAMREPARANVSASSSCSSKLGSIDISAEISIQGMINP